MGDAGHHHFAKDKHLFGIEPNKEAVADLLRYKTEGEVLDLGVGYGQNALYLANKGFAVTGVDNDRAAVKSYLDYGRRLNLRNIKGVVEDITKFSFPKKFDIIVSTSTLYLLQKNQINDLIFKIKQHTKKAGLNVLTVFTEQSSLTDFPYLFKANELKDYYKGWEILEYKEYFSKGSHSHEKGHHNTEKPHDHVIASIIARKP